MKRGAVTKSDSDGKLVLERKMLGVIHLLAVDRNGCIGCGICVKMCPQEAPKLSRAATQDGKLLKKGVIDIDADKCTLCGACALFCPANAVESMRNGKKMVPVSEAEVFPDPLKQVIVDKGRCDISCELACDKECPTEAINVAVEQASGKTAKILEMNVDGKKCIYCGKCELACPQTAIRVVKPFQGLVRLDMDRCPEKCEVCLEVCPAKALELGQDRRPRIAEESCIYCGACEEACPEKAIRVERTRILHTPVVSGAWLKALEKLMSHQYLVKESSAKSMKKLRDVVTNIDRF